MDARIISRAGFLCRKPNAGDAASNGHIGSAQSSALLAAQSPWPRRLRAQAGRTLAGNVRQGRRHGQQAVDSAGKRYKDAGAPPNAVIGGEGNCLRIAQDRKSGAATKYALRLAGAAMRTAAGAVVKK